jgi:aminoglycoside/choline kinase family phosphotransferase
MHQHLPAEFNAALYLWEQNYFFENCLGRHFEVEPARIDNLAALPALHDIAERLAGLPRVLVHRDFQSQNILLRNGQAYLIDFQGMRPGLAHYDLASLLFDPYVELSDAERNELLEHYCGDKPGADFLETLRPCAMQRLMQALGAYGFLGLVKDHKHFLRYIPKAVQSLCEIVGKLDNLQPLEEQLTEIISARFGQPL